MLRVTYYRILGTNSPSTASRRVNIMPMIVTIAKAKATSTAMKVLSGTAYFIAYLRRYHRNIILYIVSEDR